MCGLLFLEIGGGSWINTSFFQFKSVVIDMDPLYWSEKAIKLSHIFDHLLTFLQSCCNYTENFDIFGKLELSVVS